MEDAANAVQYCWSHGIAHCDLSPNNFVWFPSMEQPVKLIDFGYAICFETEDRFKGGTPGYYSPEQIFRGKPLEKSDVFGLGCLFYNFHPIPKLPWTPNNGAQDLRDFDRKYSKHLELNLHKECKQRHISAQDTRLLIKMLKVCPEDRPNWEDILKEISEMKPAEKQLDLSKSGETVMHHRSYEHNNANRPDPMATTADEGQVDDEKEPTEENLEHATDRSSVRMDQPESVASTANQQEVDDERTAWEENSNHEDNSYTRSNYQYSLTSVERNNQRQNRRYEENLQQLENDIRFDSERTETINRVRSEVKKKVDEARQGMENADGEDSIDQVATTIRKQVTEIGMEGKSDIAGHAEEEEKVLKKKVSESESMIAELVNDAYEEINKMNVKFAKSNKKACAKAME